MNLLLLLLDYTLKTSAMLLLALAIVSLLGRRSAALRHWILATALLGAAVMPLVQPVVPTWRLPEVLRGHEMVRPDPQSAARLSTDDSAIAHRAPEVAATTALPLATAVVATWLLGVLVCLCSLVVGIRRLTRVAARARRIENGAWADRVEEIRREYGFRQRVTLLEAAGPALLLAWGWRRPTVIVPVTARDWPADRVSLVLHHELAHISRGDWVVQLAAELMRAVYWFNPLVWITCGRLRQESERACDDAVIARGVEGSEYATHLVEIARELQSPELWMPAPAMARRSNLEGRVRAMLNSRVDRRPLSRRAAAVLLIALMGISTLVAGFAAAQGFASLAGAIVDPTDAVLPDVTLVLTNDASGAKYELRSDRTGRYEFVGLPPGGYRLEARIPGFAAFHGQVTLTGQNVEQNLTLQVGSLQETVTVATNDNHMGSTVDVGRHAAMTQAVEEKRQKRAAAACPGAPQSGSVRIGGNIRPPMKLRDVRPQYPASLRGAEIDGAVMIKGRIGTDGALEEVTVVSSPHPDLADSAVTAIGQWQFDATLLNCVPVPVDLNVTVNYVRR